MLNKECSIKINTENALVNDEIYIVETLTDVKPLYFYNFFKRFFDIACSLIGLIVLFIPMIIIGLIVKLTSEGPAIYSQERLGLNGKPFMVYKFRSMYIDAEKNGAQWAKKDDDRITRFGSLLRKMRLDELPQFVNILFGQMSFVGPRPERKVFYDEFEKTIHGFHQRLYVKPGLTGWAQINGGYDLGPKEKVILDIEYIKNRSLKMDIKCIFKTVAVIFGRKGAR